MTDAFEDKAPRLKLRELVAGGAFAGKQIAVFGASRLSSNLMKELAGLDVVAVVDNDPGKVGTTFAGVEVRRPGEVFVPTRDDLAIVVGSYAVEEIADQLSSFGYSRSDAVVTFGPEPADLSVRWFLSQLSRMATAWRAWRRTGGHRARRTTVFFAPFTGLGDIYYIGLWFAAYCERRAVRGYEFVCASERSARLAGRFGISNVRVAARADIERGHDYARFAHVDLSRYVDLNYGDLEVASVAMEGFKGLTYEAMYVHRNFDLPAGTAVRQPVFAEPDGDIDAYLAAEGLVRGSTVVLAPHAVTLKSPVSQGFWTSLAGELAQRGYTVWPPTSRGRREPLPGTRALSFAPEDAVPILDALGYLVSVRSGLCDPVSGSTATRSCCSRERPDVAQGHAARVPDARDQRAGGSAGGVGLQLRRRDRDFRRFLSDSKKGRVLVNMPRSRSNKVPWWLTRPPCGMGPSSGVGPWSASVDHRSSRIRRAWGHRRERLQDPESGAALRDGRPGGRSVRRPAVVFTNDKFPRAVTPEGRLKSPEDWEVVGVTVRRGASIGARAVCVAPVEVGEWAMVAAGAVVTADVPAHGLVVGSPARRIGWVGRSGHRLQPLAPTWWTPRRATAFRRSTPFLSAR